MKANLLYRDRDLDPGDARQAATAALVQDLGLDILFGAMAAGDRFLLDVARTTVLASLDDPDAIRYRQAILADCEAHPAVVRELYGIAGEGIEGERQVWGAAFGRSPELLLLRSVDVLQLFVGLLKRLRRIADEHGPGFASEGFSRFFAMLATELDDAYLRTIDDHLHRLRFQDGMLMSADLGAGNRGTNYVLRRSRSARRSWRERLALWDRSGLVYEIPDRDESGATALRELRGRGLSLAASALAQSTDHILSFFRLLRSELGFYIGCLHLHELLARKGEPTCFPDPAPAGRPVLHARGLYDACLSLSVAGRVIGNEVDADGASLVMITGANQGGKSTFLRGLGVAQLMMQCGMFVPAESFEADIRDGIFTHFKREEDASLTSGKLDEELSRMSSIIDQLTPNSLILLNESFASTNEREGSEIARQIVRALLEAGVKVCYVTHLFDLAHRFYLRQPASSLFLRAEREVDGRPTFRLVRGEPLPTSHGGDVYRRVFGAPPGIVSPAAEGEVA